MKIRVYDKFDEAVLERELAPADVACVVDEGLVWIRDGDGELEQMSPGDHPDFVVGGSVYAWHPDEGTADDATYAGELGHIVDVYFERWYDDWMWLGRVGSAEAALGQLRGWLGVLDDSWVYFGD